jgi:hypothetical protein
MSNPRETDPLLDPEIDPQERKELARVAAQLETERPVPQPAFRGELGRRLLGQLEPGRAQPRGLRMLITAYAGSGLCLLAVAAVGVAGAGPLAA